MAKFIMYFKQGTSKKEKQLSLLGYLRLMTSNDGSLMLNDCVTKIDVIEGSNWELNLDKTIRRISERFQINGKPLKKGDLVKVYAYDEDKEVVFDHIDETTLLMIDSEGNEYLDIVK